MRVHFNADMSERFSDIVHQTLCDAGWQPGRRRSDLVDAWENEMGEKEGWHMFQAAKRILLEFGGLKIFPPRNLGSKYDSNAFEINPALQIGERTEYVRYESQIGCRLFPLAEVANGMEQISVDEYGRVFDNMHIFALIGNTFEEALEYLIHRKHEIKVVPFTTRT